MRVDATGRFIVLEGLDGAGTTTQATRLCHWLGEQGVSHVRTCEPTDGPVGRVVRETLRGSVDAPAPTTLPWLFAADRADHLQRLVVPTLARGEHVVSDRYYPSSLAYQQLDLSYERVRSLNREFRVPDLILFLRVPVETCLARIESRTDQPREIFEHRRKLEVIHAAYDQVMENLTNAGEPVELLDGTEEADGVERRIRALLLRRGWA